MVPINNSDTAWLIVADYHQDNAIGHPDELREDVYNPEINDWYYKNGINLLQNDFNRPRSVGGFIVGVNVGSTMGASGYVGSINTYRRQAGEAHDIGDGTSKGRLVGGNEPN